MKTNGAGIMLEKCIEKNVDKSWYKTIYQIMKHDEIKKLDSFLEKEYSTNIIFPSEENIFRAFSLTSLDNVKVVIIGQDPYHGEGQANGLAFSVRKDIKTPPSLKNIIKELCYEYKTKQPKSNDLSGWAKQGVLLLNAVLTVRKGNPNSHAGEGWEYFTSKIIESISMQRKKVVYMLWGRYAQKIEKHILSDDNLILKSTHPSPFSAHRGFFGNNHFLKANKYLQENGRETIRWFD